MAIVPMPDGPRVNPTVPDAKPISILEPRESKITAQSIANAQSSSNGLLKAARESYERMSDARATEAYNNVRIAVNDLLMGENGALQKKGTEVTNSKKPFVQDYYEQIEKIFEQETKGLDTYQRQLIEGRKQKYLANRRLELTKHLIKQADEVQMGVAKDAAEIAVDTITANPRDLDSVSDARAEIEKNARIMMRGQDETVIRNAIDKTVSSALVSAITIALANNNPEEAEALRKHYHKKGLTALDELKIQPKIKEALEKKIQNVRTEQAVNAVNASLTPEAIVARILPKGDGQQFDSKKYNDVATFATENGIPEAANVLYFLGDKGKKVIEDWKKSNEESIKKGEKPTDFNEGILLEMLTPEQRNTLNDLGRVFNGVGSGDKDIIREQILIANPNIDPKTLDSAVKEVHENRVRNIALNKAQSSNQASQALAQLKNGRRWKDIPDTETNYLPDHTKRGLAEYDRRKALNCLVTDSDAYADLAYDNEKLKKMNWADFYAYSGSLNTEDFNALQSRKQKLEKMGDKELNDLTTGLSREYDDAFGRLGFEAKTAGQRKVFNVMKRVVIDRLTDRINEHPEKRPSSEEIRTMMNDELTKCSYTIKSGLFFFGDSTYTAGDTLLKTHSVNSSGSSVEAILDAGAKSNGIADPEDLDRNELLIRIAMNGPKKPIPGVDAMYRKMEEDRTTLNEIIRDLRSPSKDKEGRTHPPRMADNYLDKNLIVYAYMKANAKTTRATGK